MKIDISHIELFDELTNYFINSGILFGLKPASKQGGYMYKLLA